METDNIIVSLTRNFAIRCINLFKFLSSKKEFIIAKQILRSGTSIGANVAEATYAQSKADFISKMHIALKEARETLYWLDLLHATNYIDNSSFESINNDCKQIIGTLVKIINSAKKDLA